MVEANVEQMTKLFERIRAWLMAPMDLKQQERHKELMDGLGLFQHNLYVTCNKVDDLKVEVEKLATQIQAAHVTERQPVFEYSDYDSAMVAQMIDMQRNPEKEH